jgi:type I restriction enzyme S subunit
MLKNTPELRFPEFEGEWQCNTVGNLLEFKNYITYDRIIGNVDVEDKIIEKYAVLYADILFQQSSETRE